MLNMSFSHVDDFNICLFSPLPLHRSARLVLPAVAYVISVGNVFSLINMAVVKHRPVDLPGFQHRVVSIGYNFITYDQYVLLQIKYGFRFMHEQRLLFCTVSVGTLSMV